MPQVEAASCGVPVAAVNYSAMADVIKFTKGYPINVKSLYRELETGADRAHPDNEHLAEILSKHFSLPQQERDRKCFESRKGVMKRYSWDKTAKVWEDYIDSYVPVGLQGQWDSPPVFLNLPANRPKFDNSEDFVRWTYAEILKEPHKAYSYEATEFTQSLMFGSHVNGGGAFNEDMFWDIMVSRLRNKNAAEAIRCGHQQLPPEQFIEEAYRRQQ
jgi:hypothetical protein